MSRPITLFSGYTQRENRTTNYCLLILKMLYEESPKFLAQVLSTLVGDDLGEHIGVRFRQQERKGASIPDGLIVQPPFAVYLETKNFDWFHDDQLENHLEGLSKEAAGVRVLIALSNFEATETQRFAKIRNLCATKYRNSIVFAQVSFEDFAEALRIERLSTNLSDAVRDFRSYLDEQNLLPTWRRLLDVVNCAGIPEDVITGRVYLCPASGGAYNHSRCKYFGMYRNKRVEAVALIEAVVDVRDSDDVVLKWQNVSADKSDLIAKATAIHQERRAGQYPMRVFLLGDPFETDFRKDTSGGMQSSKQYFDIDALNASDASELALALRQKKWSDLRER